MLLKVLERGSGGVLIGGFGSAECGGRKVC